MAGTWVISFAIMMSGGALGIAQAFMFKPAAKAVMSFRASDSADVRT